MTQRYPPPNGAQIPLILWICAALCAHFVMAEGGDQVAQVHDDHKALQAFASDVRQRVGVVAPEVDIDLGSTRADLTEPPAPPPDVKKEQQKKAEEKKKEEQKKAEEKKKLDPIAKVVEKREDKTLPIPPIEIDKRIAVKQHAKPNQEDNPNAKFVGNEANHVDKEEVATITSHDQDDPNPTPGGNHQNADKSVGDSEHTKIAESDYHPGEKDKGPGEKGTEFDLIPMPPSDRPQSANPQEGPTAKLPPQSGGDGRVQNAPQETAKIETQPQGTTSQPSPDIVEAPGGWMFTNPRAGVGANDGRPGVDPRVLQPPSGNQKPMFGLGGQPMPGRPNLNLTQSGVVAIVGSDQLRKEREADGERRKSEHRGSWAASNFEKWRTAIENYVSSVKPGNQTALNTAAVPFATYLNGMHNRIHPIFADSFLASLDSLPTTHPLNDTHLITRLEIILTKEGRLVKMGIVKTSGSTAFDIAALDSVERAQPFGPAPGAIVSPDNKVYLHWEFHRDEVYACSTMNARPFVLKNAPNETQPNPAPGPGKTAPTKERIPTDTKEVREGLLDVKTIRRSSAG